MIYKYLTIVETFQAGQIEFTGGGWSMNDEVTNVWLIVTQFYGWKWIWKLLHNCMVQSDYDKEYEWWGDQYVLQIVTQLYVWKWIWKLLHNYDKEYERWGDKCVTNCYTIVWLKVNMTKSMNDEGRNLSPIKIQCNVWKIMLI